MIKKPERYIYLTVVLLVLGFSVITSFSLSRSNINGQQGSSAESGGAISVSSGGTLENTTQSEVGESINSPSAQENSGNLNESTMPEKADDQEDFTTSLQDVAAVDSVALTPEVETKDSTTPEWNGETEDIEITYSEAERTVAAMLAQDSGTDGDTKQVMETPDETRSESPNHDDADRTVFVMTDEMATSGESQDKKITIFLSPGHGSRRPANEIGLGGLVYGSSAGNTNEIRNVLTISQRLKEKLEAAGYNVVLAREDNNSNPITDERIKMARDAGAVIGISIHSTTTLNSCWYQEMGGWRENNHAKNSVPGTLGAGNTRVVFGGSQLGVDDITAQRTAELSKHYSTIISRERAAVEGRKVINTSDASGSFSQSRGLTTYGNMALEMLLAEDIPWVYCEYSTGTSDNSMTDKQMNQYVEGLLHGILAIDFSAS